MATLNDIKARNELAEQKIRARVLRLRARAVAKIEKAGRSETAAVPNRSQRYDAATRTRLRPGPSARSGSADLHLSPTVLAALRRDCQDLARNSSTARICIHRAQELIVGDGPIVTSTTGDEAWDAEADRLWNLYADNLDPELVGSPEISGQKTLAEVLAGVVSAWCTDGDQCLVWTNRGCFQVIEGERLITPGMAYGLTKELPGGGRIVSGVELDKAGAHLAYHIADWSAQGALNAAKTRRVTTENAWLLTNPIGVKAGLTRGEPALQAVLKRIERLDSYDEKVAVAAEIATLFAAVVRTKDPAATQGIWESGTEQPAKSNANSPNVTDIEPGTINFFENADTVTALKPEFPTTNFKDYSLWHMMIIGAELGLPLVATLFDASQLSWANIKALLNMCMRSLEPSQAKLARPVRLGRARKMREWIERGLLGPRDDYDRCEVVFPKAPVVDFKSQVEGCVLAVNNGAMTRDQMTQELGTGRFVDVAKKLATEEQLIESLGLTIVQMPGAVSGGKGGGGGGGGGGPDGPADPAATDAGGGKDQAAKAAANALNGAQITAALEILAKVREGALSPEAAVTMLVAVGIPEDKAGSVVQSLSTLTAGTGDVAFKREVLKALLSVPAAREAIYNGVDIEDLIAQTGLNPEASYEAPWIPVVAASGPTVTGDAVTDGSGSIVGGEAEFNPTDPATTDSKSAGGSAGDSPEGSAGSGSEADATTAAA